MISIEEYLEAPCQTSSIPYWKIKEITIPESMTIVHNQNYIEEEYRGLTDEPYFRLKHNLYNIPAPELPTGYTISKVEIYEFATHINSCYNDISISDNELHKYSERRVFDPTLWVGIKDNITGKIVATGIGELDTECHEGIIEWIQVSTEHRKLRLGTYIVCELLNRMAKKATFATVSGKCNNPSNPELLYRKCGFRGNDIWHILKKV